MANDYFKFKEFTIFQNGCSMKVGTDGVLLGAWAEVGENDEDCSILDIGAGSGVVSLIAAQRNRSADICAVEIEKSAKQQCEQNFNDSKWGDRMRVECCSVQEFANKNKNRFKYILSNPPYFNNSLKNRDIEKTIARHTDSLPYTELAKSVEDMLTDDGVFSAIFPYVESGLFTAIAANNNLYCIKRLEVKGNNNKPIKRVLLQFSKKRANDIEVKEITIENGERHNYTEDYKELTKDYYLNF